MRPTAQPPSNRKLHGQYYTKAAIGKILVDALRQDVIGTAIELGAGQGALIRAAQGRWPEANFVSVDIDPKNAPAKNAVARRRHFVYDALRSDLPRRIGVKERSADLALCNPPFAIPQWEPHYQRILERAGLPYAGAASFGADALFIAQNLWMLRDRGELGVIVPAGLICGSRNEPIREALLSQHDVHQVVELPVGAFSNTEVRTYLLCLQKGGGTRTAIQLRSLSEEESSIEVEPSDAAQRMDYSFYAATPRKRVSKRAASAIEVQRGSIENAAAREIGIKVLHTTDIQGSCIKWVQPRAPAPPSYATQAKKGDLLMARVGRDFHAKLSILHSARAVISDCVFAIRSDVYTPEQLLQAFSSESGQSWLASRARGACARYITKDDLLMFPIREILK
ncbi:N-6 DNA methylase [Xanthomonas sacchari]|uniref:N-6 DNA methylase n=1 Tax=Xanthomonas sacchari TaxID=56458 RepID=UPI0022556067|nr:N-6 DNA methylase [Xanthomonas sacchari]MCW0375129.1 hypothetical protein [Xanthomonas sacchari]